jgi:hypothetical protein
MPVRMECAPAFNYAQATHTTKFVPDPSAPDQHPKALFTSPPQNTSQDGSSFAGDAPWAGLDLDLRVVSELQQDSGSAACASSPHAVDLQLLDLSDRGHKGPGVYADMQLSEGQTVTFILRITPEANKANKERDEHDAQKHQAPHELLVPSKEKAQELGISFDKLAKAKSHLSPEDDPYLTPELLKELFTVRPFDYVPLQLTACSYALNRCTGSRRTTTGSAGSGSRATRAHGRRPCTALRSHSSCSSSSRRVRSWRARRLACRSSLEGQGIGIIGMR